MPHKQVTNEDKRHVEVKKFTIDVQRSKFYELFLRVFNGSLDLTEREIHVMVFLEKNLINRETGLVDLSSQARTQMLDSINEAMNLSGKKSNISYNQLNNIILHLRHKGMLSMKQKPEGGKEYYLAEQVLWKDPGSVKQLQIKFIQREG